MNLSALGSQRRNLTGAESLTHSTQAQRGVSSAINTLLNSHCVSIARRQATTNLQRLLTT
jgi:hypothetical protein